MPFCGPAALSVIAPAQPARCGISPTTGSAIRHNALRNAGDALPLAVVVPYLGIEADDALEMAEQTEV